VLTTSPFASMSSRTPSPDDALLAALQARDQAAFKEVVARFGSRVLNTCLGLVQNRPDAEDLTQEVFVQVFEQCQSFRGEAKLSTWIYRIAVNKALEHLRRHKRKKRFAFLTSLFAEDGAALKHDAPDFVHPGVLAERKEQATLLFDAIARLPEKQRVAFTLAQVEQLPQADIAETLETTVGAVEALIQRAKAQLRKDLGAYYKTYLEK